MSQNSFFTGETSSGGIQGVVVGIVTDNEDPKNLGRVKLRFPWRDADDESYWARIATEMAGDAYGTYFLPEVDDEVLVAFENGDIHNPFVIGSLWNGKQKPPEQNKDGKNDIREIRSRSDHTIRFDDEKEGSVTVQTSDGHKIVIDDKSETISIRDDGKKNTITLDSGKGKVAIKADKEISLDAKTISIDGKKSIELSSKKSVDIAGNTTVSIDSSGKLDLSSSGLMDFKAVGPLMIKGAIIQLN